MVLTASSLTAALPKPKYVGNNDAPNLHNENRGPRVVGPEFLTQGQVVVRRSGPPSYGQRTGWRPKSAEDYGDGGAFPEVSITQYPLDMGKKGVTKTKALALRLDEDGNADYTAIARQGHSADRIVQASYRDLIPLRQRANIGEIYLARPSDEEIQATAERTRLALAGKISSHEASQKVGIKSTARKEPTYHHYVPSAQMGRQFQQGGRLIKTMERQIDPMEPAKFKAKKIPRGPPSPPAPVLHSPPRKLTARDQENWKIPPSVSNWKNPKGFTVPLDKRMAANDKDLMDNTINDRFAGLAEDLHLAERLAREEIRERALYQQRVADKEKTEQEEKLRRIALEAREATTARLKQRRPSRRSRSRSDSRSMSRSSYTASSRSASDSEDDTAARERRERRREQDQEAERKLRQTRMGTERRTLVMAREQNRDISERIALGLAKPTQSKESMYDSRLFNRSSGFESGFNEDQAYDKPLFAARDAMNSIYSSTGRQDEDDDGPDNGETLDKIKKASRFEVLGKAGKGFKGAEDADRREGPVQFERDDRMNPARAKALEDRVQEPEKGVDPFAEVDSFLESVAADTGGQSGGKRRYGLEKRDESPRRSKRSRRCSDD